jgi:acyl-CoA oxidase
MWTGKQVAARFRRVMEALSGSEDVSELPEMHAVSSGLKALTTFEGAAGLEECRKCCGGHGVLMVSGVAQMALDYTTYVTAEGDRIILELQSARYLIKQLEQARASKAVSGLCAYLAPCKDRAFDPSAEVTCRVSHEQGFLDLDLLLRLFRGRALNAVVEVGDRLEALVKSGKSFDLAWNACAIDLVQASRAHCYFVMLNNFCEALVSMTDAGVRRVMGDVARLFALQNMVEDLGSFDLVRAQRAAVRAAVRHLLEVLRPDIIALTDAWEFPDNTLNSALGRHDGDVYTSLYNAAKASPLNRVDPFPGYAEHLRPQLDLDFIKDQKAKQRQGLVVGGKL